MKLIVALIQPHRLPDVKKALTDVEVHLLTVSGALGAGRQRGYTEQFRGTIYETKLLKKVRLEIAVNEDFVEPAIKAIIHGARSGNIGDGKIFVMPMDECVRIRTGERGSKAIG